MESEKPVRRRTRKTRPWVKAADTMARVAITVGGFGVIGAVCMVCVFLAWVVAPLVLPARVAPEVAIPSGGAVPLEIGLDDDARTVWALLPDGRVDWIDARDGSTIASFEPFGPPPTAIDFPPDRSKGILGYADGTIRTVEIGFKTAFPSDEQAPEAARNLAPGESEIRDGAVWARSEDGHLKTTRLAVEAADPIDATEGARRVADVSLAVSGGTLSVAVLAEDGSVRLLRLREKKNLLTGKIEVRRETVEVRGAGSDSPVPDRVLVSGLGDQVLAIRNGGGTVRYAIGPDGATDAERFDLVSATEATLTAARFMLGGSTLVAADSTGAVNGWFAIRSAEATATDGLKWVRAHSVGGADDPAIAVASSPRGRVVATLRADGTAQAIQMTTARELVEFSFDAAKASDLSGAGARLAFGPKGDALAAAIPGGLAIRKLDLAHPEASPSAYFSKVWYEGFPEPAHVWQSSGADAFEPKYGMMPLVFGTLKATFYSMLFGAPLALLAAVYTSEFLHGNVRHRVKPAIELMASLPSVVLGFLGALVLAPFAEAHLARVLAAVAIVPGTFLLFAHLWQTIPRPYSLTLAPWRLTATVATLPVALGVSWAAGPILERLLFAGDVFLWLDGQRGGAWGGWIYILFPPAGATTAYLTARHVTPRLRARALGMSPGRASGIELAKFVAGVLVAGLAAVVAGGALAALGFDPRGSLMGSYAQRNALVVGFVMGFAVVPIVYTIAEDALSSVPNHLRSASLAAGATPWQTAVLVVVPTALSGLFSAVMVGLGRAVGETMVVLMAAGNTPVMEWNVFNGFRTLSANLAVELPEAVRDSTHYRTLFLAAFVLFLITFVLNTAAERVRQRFRKRAYQL